MNWYTGIGRLGSDPEKKELTTSTVVNFSIAVPEGKDKDPNWVECYGWNEVADQISNTFKKGDLIMVGGPLKENVFMRGDTKVSKLKVNVQKWWFVPRNTK